MVLYTPVADLRAFFDFDNDVPDFRAGYNICPSQQILAVRAAHDRPGREGGLLRWGLVPAWAKDESIGNKLSNARSETVHEKPSFRAALKKRRCLIPANGFYEWRSVGGKKLPVYIRFRDERPFAIAGLWECWGKGEAPLETATLLTTSPNRLMEPIHNRMPVILAPEDFNLWLDPGITDVEALRHLFTPFAADEMIATEVSTAVNNPRNQGPELISPATLF
jgi:putative SOS response-associated peptidase YedK